MILCPKTGNLCMSAACDLECFVRPLLNVTTPEDWKTPVTSYMFPEPPRFATIPIEELRSIYAGLGKAIESGDPLQIGLILGQVYKELEKYVNTSTTGNNGATVSINPESSTVQFRSSERSDITFGNKE